MNFIEIGNGDRPSVVFAHGWARTHSDFIPVAESLEPQMKSLLLDFPGFGKTTRPTENWTTIDYANHAAKFIKKHADGPIIWVGHSFGGRVGLRLAVQHPELLSGLLLLGCAGLPSQPSLPQKLRRNFRQAQFRFLRNRAKSEAETAELEKKFGSPDYVASKEINMRDIFLSTIREDQSKDLPRIKTKTMLMYGENDTETPPELGQRMHELVPNSRFETLPEFDHLNLLYRGRHVIAMRIKQLAAGDTA